MTLYALVVNDTAVNVSTDPDNEFHPDVAKDFIEVPDYVKAGWKRTDSEWQVPVVEEPEKVYPSIDPMVFYMAFTPKERMAIKKSEDPEVQEFWETYNLAVTTKTQINMNLKSNREAIAYLATPAPDGPGILTPDRVEDILNGVAQ